MPGMWTSEDIPGQQGRVAVVTGANGGLGLEVARALAARGATVVMAARDQDKARRAQRAILADVPAARLELRELDLASLDSVRACAEAVAADHDRIDLLVNNAGIMGIPEQATADGFEKQLGVNHLGHFALTRLLLPQLLAAPAARVVSVTSFARFMGRSVSARYPDSPGRYGPWSAYGRSKLANLLFAAELQRRFDAAVSAGGPASTPPGRRRVASRPR
jgi:NAD(P)-dependent dehydrogenase (short-subunit alcohol dehydrogenase family)